MISRAREEMNVLGYTNLGKIFTHHQIDEMYSCLTDFKEKEIREVGKDILNEFGDLEIMRALCRHGGIFLEILENEFLNDYINSVLNETSILHGYFGFVYYKGKNSDITGYKFHRDQAWFKDSRTSVQVMIPLVDFTELNGATELVPSTHMFAKRPSDEFLEKHKVRMSVKKGEVFSFDGCVWHRAGVNTQDLPRVFVLLHYRLGIFKQQIRLCETCDLQCASDIVKARLGWNVREMDSHEEWRSENRKWQSGQHGTKNVNLHEDQ